MKWYKTTILSLVLVKWISCNSDTKTVMQMAAKKRNLVLTTHLRELCLRFVIRRPYMLTHSCSTFSAVFDFLSAIETPNFSDLSGYRYTPALRCNWCAGVLCVMVTHGPITSLLHGSCADHQQKPSFLRCPQIPLSVAGCQRSLKSIVSESRSAA